MLEMAKNKKDNSIELELVTSASSSSGGLITSSSMLSMLKRSREHGEDISAVMKEERELRAKEESLPSFLKNPAKSYEYRSMNSSPIDFNASNAMSFQGAEIDSETFLALPNTFGSQNLIDINAGRSVSPMIQEAIISSSAVEPNGILSIDYRLEEAKKLSSISQENDQLIDQDLENAEWED
jgi:hypothetical protein